MSKTEADKIKIHFESVRDILEYSCGLSAQQVQELQKCCYEKAITTIYPNSELTLQLMQDSCFKILHKKDTYEGIIQSLKV